MKFTKKLYTFLAAVTFFLSPLAVDAQTVSGSEQGHDYVDMGLSVMWATTNLGATYPTGYGSFYAWGETSTAPGLNYNRANCKTNTLNITTLDASRDAAAKQWGGEWRMPTKAEFDELIANTTVTVENVDDVRVFKFKSKKNGNELYLPAAGGRGDTSTAYRNEDGYYWSSTGVSGEKAVCLMADGATKSVKSGENLRYFGQSIRPVIKKKKSEKQTFTVNGVSFVMVPVSGGTFSMGSNNGDSDEKPVHSVTLSGYMIGETEVTQALWKAVMGSNPSYHKGDNLPVERVSWDDCQEFIRKLNSITGRSFRLPTEAEWEYAARGGSGSRGYEYSGSDNLDSVAWYTGNSSDNTHAVKTKAPNELGLYDMSGNVWEWCRDWYGPYPSGPQTNPSGPSSGSDRVLRGGSSYDGATYCRVALRLSDTPSNRSVLGLRLVL